MLRIVLPVAAYALGCASGAYYLVRLRTGRDLRTLGSGNAGARNAGRVLGSGGFAAALAIDAGKGALVTWGAHALGMSDTVAVACAVAVIAGHVWPAQLGFRGGKGAATALGVLLAYDTLLAVILVAVGLMVLAATRRLEVAGFAALLLAPIVGGALGHGMGAVIGLALMVAIVVTAHRSNASSDAVSPNGAPLTDLHGTQALP